MSTRLSHSYQEFPTSQPRRPEHFEGPVSVKKHTISYASHCSRASSIYHTLELLDSLSYLFQPSSSTASFGYLTRIATSWL